MTIQHTTPVPIPEALRLAAWLTEGAWHKMTLGDVEAAGRELRRLHAIVASAPVAPTDENRALDLLAAMFDAYESGVQCYEDPEDQTGYLGHALQLDNDTFHACADLLNRRRPVKSTQAAPVAPAPQPAVPTIMRWHPLAGWGMKPAANGLYVRYEDHAAALAAAPKVDHIADASKMVPAPLQQGEYLPLQGLAAYLRAEAVGVTGVPRETLRSWANEVDAAARGAAQAAPDNRVPEACTNLLAYALQDDMHNRLTPRVVDIAYTAFMQAKRPNDEDGASDWFNTKPKVAEMIAKLRKDLIEELAAQPAPVTEDADDAARWRLLPLFMQGYDVDWVELLYNLEVTFKRGVRAQAAQPKEASNAG